MSISRRDFFTEAFNKAVSRIPKIIPNGVNNLLGIEKKQPISAEEAAFQLAKMPRKRSFLDSIVQNCQSNNAGSIIKDKVDKPSTK